LELAAVALKGDPKLGGLKGYVQDLKEGRRMLMDAMDKNVPVPTPFTAFYARFRSREKESFFRKDAGRSRPCFWRT
jgi:6-phosphogluconate dehydrogenase